MPEIVESKIYDPDCLARLVKTSVGCMPRRRCNTPAALEFNGTARARLFFARPWVIQACRFSKSTWAQVRDKTSVARMPVATANRLTSCIY